MLTTIFIGLLIILIGAVFCLFGYRLFIYLLPVWGFVAGFLMGAQGVATIFGEGFLATLTGWAVGVLFGLFVALVSYFLFEFAIYLFATTFGLAVGAGIMYALGIESGLLVAIAALVGAIVLIVLVAFLDVKKWLIVVLTALGGAAAILAGILTVLGKVSLTGYQAGANPVRSTVEDSLLWIVVWLGFGVAGIVFQARTTKDFFKHCGADFTFTDVDLLTGDERKNVIEEIKQINPKLSFPTIIIEDRVIVGFKKDEIREALGL